MLKKILFISSGLICLSCGDSDSNPLTESKSDLNPPTNLNSLNLEDSIELRFNGSNTESDFQGYYVFGTKTPWSDLQPLIKFPSNAGTDQEGNARAWYQSVGIPRCTDNDAFFAKFGMGASGVACEGSGVSKSVDGEDEDSDENSANEFKNLILQCSNPETALDLSILKGDDYKPGALQKCLVNKVWDPSLDTPAQVAIEGGSEYTFFAVSVMGSDFDSISWTSNIIAGAASSTAVNSQEITLNTGEFKKISFDMTALTATVDSSPSTCTGNVCTIAKANSQESTVPTIWIGRASSGTSYTQRILVSDSQDSSSSLYLSAKDSKVSDPGGTDPSAVTARVPNAMPNDISSADGIVNPIYGHDVLDFKIIHNESNYYGKLVIENISYADESGSVGNFGTATIKLSVILQTGAGVLHYLK
ncbi:MAG: hypothetical protein AB8G05_14790 [Oligoflexales bacterium]